VQHRARHTTGELPLVNMPMEITFTPCAVAA